MPKVHYTVEAFRHDIKEILSEISATPVGERNGNYLITTDMCLNVVDDFIKRRIKTLKDGFLDMPHWNVEPSRHEEHVIEIEFYNLDVNDGEGIN